jgi:uncharacterized membrane protein
LGDIDPITEFPYFTFLYADLHAHMIALPVTLLSLGWVISVVLGKGRWGEPGSGRLSWLSAGLGLFLGGLAIGALRPTNTWDLPTYLLLGAIALAYAYLTNPTRIKVPGLSRLSPIWQRILLAGGSILIVGDAVLLWLLLLSTPGS